ncbi:hypothetical protein E3P92_03347 [Wallemia ichthyophaga]|uniref:Uncharacterized protein n=1 Tax=Wallemia ichthyophaga (strain EXF-994 / CBS 113033) TaxID=1299270 RepID=R9ANN2_WALI9|nr:uncharacterized protein J056_003127 [Wallemia ichthyophaga EXF-994]TIA69904.1 hypothetical protein E3P91_03386 [Wallemia ichthyophaga]EOR03670.1 hypothetical protein J056_003127 [Wallemia ichthyophaga EXF-994]TIA79298.1 hypothetical protein E3P98_03396 [Wallemia ichthyophaga]TIA88340.1 hypothetical protein E3P97_03566 [Wallemia ichthyophaga]TIA96472.1 hypothetical protein E3P95_03274 [Wallemia ichthyophaga]
MDYSSAIRGFFSSVRQTAEEEVQSFFDNASTSVVEATDSDRPTKKRKKVKRSSSDHFDSSHSVPAINEVVEDQQNASTSSNSKSKSNHLNKAHIKSLQTPHIPGCYPITPAAHLSASYNNLIDSTDNKTKSNALESQVVDMDSFNELRRSYDHLLSAVERNTAFHNQTQARNERRIQHLESKVKTLTDMITKPNQERERLRQEEDTTMLHQKRQRSQEFRDMAAAQPSSTPHNPPPKRYNQRSNEAHAKTVSNTDTNKSLNMNQFLSEIRSVKLRKVGLPSKCAVEKMPALNYSWHGKALDDHSIFPSPPPSHNYSRTPSAYSLNDVFTEKPLTLFDELNGKLKHSN